MEQILIFLNNTNFTVQIERYFIYIVHIVNKPPIIISHKQRILVAIKSLPWAINTPHYTSLRKIIWLFNNLRDFDPNATIITLLLSFTFKYHKIFSPVVPNVCRRNLTRGGHTAIAMSDVAGLRWQCTGVRLISLPLFKLLDSIED